MDLDACFSGYWRLTRVVSRVGRPGLFYHKVAFRLSAFTGEDLNSAACWVIRNHLQKITTFHSTLLFLPLSPSFMYSCSISHIWGQDFYWQAVLENSAACWHLRTLFLLYGPLGKHYKMSSILLKYPTFESVFHISWTKKSSIFFTFANKKFGQVRADLNLFSNLYFLKVFFHIFMDKNISFNLSLHLALNNFVFELFGSK